jgi:AraC-like DNA-binding protein
MGAPTRANAATQLNDYPLGFADVSHLDYEEKRRWQGVTPTQFHNLCWVPAEPQEGANVVSDFTNITNTSPERMATDDDIVLAISHAHQHIQTLGRIEARSWLAETRLTPEAVAAMHKKLQSPDASTDSTASTRPGRRELEAYRVLKELEVESFTPSSTSAPRKLTCACLLAEPQDSRCAVCKTGSTVGLKQTYNPAKWNGEYSPAMSQEDKPRRVCDDPDDQPKRGCECGEQFPSETKLNRNLATFKGPGRHTGTSDCLPFMGGAYVWIKTRTGLDVDAHASDCLI